ncbi:MAG: hypothetical protein IIW02_02800 [Clostridia bacterium]|nr:hypothetical protein [Clostridia bacterium]
MFTIRSEYEALEVFNKEDIEDAKQIADEKAAWGYRVYDAEGNIAYAPYSEMVTKMLSEGKRITDHVRQAGFKYGHAMVNPAIDEINKTVSCDRFVGWVLYNVGFTDQPEANGLYVYDGRDPSHDLATFCEKHGFARIEDPEDLRAGDILFVIPKQSSKGITYGSHTFMCAGRANETDFYRYDCGSDHRIQSVQPMCEPIKEFLFGYRPN